MKTPSFPSELQPRLLFPEKPNDLDIIYDEALGGEPVRGTNPALPGEHRLSLQIQLLALN